MYTYGMHKDPKGVNSTKGWLGHCSSLPPTCDRPAQKIDYRHWVGPSHSKDQQGRGTQMAARTVRDHGKLADAAYSNVLQKILSHQLSGGSVIQERKLAEMLGISRTPMRDALGEFEREAVTWCRASSGCGMSKSP